MAVRPVFCASIIAPFYKEKSIEFQYFSGFALSQKQRSISSLHESFQQIDPDKRILEISSKSTELIGNQLSAFNLLLSTPSGERHLENVFQAAKVFGDKGPYLDLLDCSPAEAKKDERLKTSGVLTAFRLFGEEFPLEPKDYFYNWIYSKALYNQSADYRKIFEYDAFTDIEFNPQKSINCQARTVAIFVGLEKAGLLDNAMKSKEAYLEIVYGPKKKEEHFEQMSLFEL